VLHFWGSNAQNFKSKLQSRGLISALGQLKSAPEMIEMRTFLFKSATAAGRAFLWVDFFSFVHNINGASVYNNPRLQF
jgi:hypothetical protein